MSKNLLRIGLVASLSFASPAFAFFSLPEGDLLLQGGGYWLSAGEEQDIAIENLVGNEYTVNDDTSGSGLLGVGFLYHTIDHPAYKLDVGLNLFYLFEADVQGEVIQEHEFANLEYTYDISHLPLYAEAKNTFRVISDKDKYYVTLSGGVGVNWMKTSEYREHSINNTSTIPDNPYSGETEAVFSATAAVGFKIAGVLGGNDLEFGYRFFYLGEGEFENRNSQVLDTFKTGSVFANALVITVSMI